MNLEAVSARLLGVVINQVETACCSHLDYDYRPELGDDDANARNGDLRVPGMRKHRLADKRRHFRGQAADGAEPSELPGPNGTQWLIWRMRRVANEPSSRVSEYGKSGCLVCPTAAIYRSIMKILHLRQGLETRRSVYDALRA